MLHLFVLHAGDRLTEENDYTEADGCDLRQISRSFERQ